MNIKNILLIHKKSAYELLRFNKERLMRVRNPVYQQERDYFLKSHKDHYETLDYIENILKEKKLKYKKVFRDSNIQYKKHDLVITVGGDGTFLKTTPHLNKEYILGVNSAPNFSVGRLCNATKHNFKKMIEKVQADQHQISPLQRIELYFKESKQRYLALNDCLITHVNPAEMSRYILCLGQRVEKQRSSGIWVSTAVGSSGAMKSAGGRVLKEDAKQFQYQTRELYAVRQNKYKLKGGLLSSRSELCIASLMHKGHVYIDGSRKSIKFPYGQNLRIKLSNKPIYSIKVK